MSDKKKTMIITQNCEAKVMLRDVQSYEELQEGLALLKILAISSHSRIQGKFVSLIIPVMTVRILPIILVSQVEKGVQEIGEKIDLFGIQA